MSSESRGGKELRESPNPKAAGFLSKLFRRKDDKEQEPPKVPTLEYDLVDGFSNRSLGSQSAALPEGLEDAQATAFSIVFQAENGPGAGLNLVHGAKVRMPDGSVVGWDEFTDPFVQRQVTRQQ